MAQAGDQITHIRVTNRNPFPIIDRYDGVQYTFEPEKPLNIPADVAKHIFGYHPAANEDELLKHVMKRFGWNTPDMVKNEQHTLYFNNLDVKPVVFKLVEVEVSEDETPYPGEDGTVMPEDGVRTRRGRPGRPKGTKNKRWGRPRKLRGKYQLGPPASEGEAETPPAPAA